MPMHLHSLNPFQFSFSVTTILFISERNNTLQQLNHAFPQGAQPFLCQLDVIPFAKGVSGRALFSSNGANQRIWRCGAESIGRDEEQAHELYIPVRINNFDFD